MSTFFKITGQAPRCPSCGIPGEPVKAETMRSLIRKGRLGHIAEDSYFFCKSPGCETVYFTGGGQTFLKGDLTVRVGIKETSSPRPICYCFSHTMEEISREIELTGKSSVLEDIKARMKKEGCSCATKNPQGACCLKRVEDYIRAELQKR